MIPTWALIVGLIFGVIWTLNALRLIYRNRQHARRQARIQREEALRWSWDLTRRHD